MNTKENKNPLWAGLVNVLIPGASQLYVNQDRGRFAGALVINGVALAAAIALASVIEQSRTYALPQGMCMGILIALVAVGLFAGGYNTARVRNNEINAAAFYNSKRHVSGASAAGQRVEIQEMRAAGLISDPEYEEKKALLELDNQQKNRAKPPQP